MTERKSAGKTRGKPFKAGNPGKPKGARHKVTLAVEALLEGEHEELTRKAIEKAKEGDIQALRLCLERIAPIRKDSTVQVSLPPVETAADAKAASTAILAAVASGEISPGEAGAVMGLLVSHKLIIEATDFEARLSALEEAKK